MKHRVFVYGSLKRGFHNHAILKEATIVGRGFAEGFLLYSLGSFPAAIGGSGTVQGELYEVDDQTLQALDRLEGHPHMYKRKETTCFIPVMNGSLPCAIYEYQHQPRGKAIASGDWS